MLFRIRAALALLLASALSSAAAAGSFVTFESGQTRPLALSPDGSRLFAVNTPDARLEIFEVNGGGLRHAASVPVGMEPVAVAPRNAERILEEAEMFGVPAVDAGRTGGARLEIACDGVALGVEIEELHRVWSTALPRALEL